MSGVTLEPGDPGLRLEPGAVVGERYELHRRLGEGGMGSVWEASHVSSHTRFALKFLKGAKDEDRRRFHREVRAAAAIRHPNVVRVHDFIELPDTLVMVMDLLEGETLGAVLRRERRLDLAELAAILLPVLSALEAAHAVGIVHRDLKPDNIFLARAEGKDVEVKVLDFGVAKLTAAEGLAAETQPLTNTGSMVGTPYYMSPEQVVAEKDLDARADIWSLGVVMYECLSGVRPTEAENVGRVLKRILLAELEPIADRCKELPEDVSSLVMRMLVGDRERRTQDLEEVRRVLDRYAAEHAPACVHAPAISSRPSPLRGRAAKTATLGALGGAVVIGGMAAVAFSSRTTVTEPTARATTARAPEPTPEPTSLASAPSPAPSVSSSSSAVASTSVVPRPLPTLAASTPATTCAAGEKLTNGHCCPRGFIWRAGRCQQDIAVTAPF